MVTLAILAARAAKVPTKPAVLRLAEKVERPPVAAVRTLALGCCALATVEAVTVTMRNPRRQNGHSSSGGLGALRGGHRPNSALYRYATQPGL